MVRTKKMVWLALLSVLVVVPLLAVACTGAPAGESGLQAQIKNLETDKAALQGELDKLKGSVKVKHFKMQTFSSAGSPPPQSFEQYAADVIRQMTNGEIDIKLFPGNGLVPSKEQFDAVKAGALHFAVASTSRDAGKIGPAGNIIGGMPFMWKTIAEGHSLFRDFGIEEIIRSLYAKHNIHVVTTEGSGGLATGFMTKVPIRTLDDFQGVKLRISGGRPAGDLFKKFGVVPVPSGMGEVYTNLATGVIDGGSAGLPTMVSLGWHEVAKYLIRPAYINNYNTMIIANADMWKSLTDKQRQIIEVAFGNWNYRAFELGQIEVAKALATLGKQGVEIINLPEADVKELVKAAQEGWEKQAGDDPTAQKALQITKDFLRSRGYID